MPLTLRLDADFRDIFEVRGYHRPERGRTIEVMTAAWSSSTAAWMGRIG